MVLIHEMVARAIHYQQLYGRFITQKKNMMQRNMLVFALFAGCLNEMAGRILFSNYYQRGFIHGMQ